MSRLIWYLFFYLAEEEIVRKHAAEQSEIIMDMIEKREEVHYRSRTSPYPGTTIMRFAVPDDKVSWKVCRFIIGQGHPCIQGQVNGYEVCSS